PTPGVARCLAAIMCRKKLPTRPTSISCGISKGEHRAPCRWRVQAAPLAFRHVSGRKMRSITVTARWDEESRTWWTDGDDIPGLCCQGATFEELADAVFALAPDLLVANGAARQGEQVEIVLTAEQRRTVAAVAA